MDKELQSAYEDLLGSVAKMRTLNHFSRFAIEGLTQVEMRVLASIFIAWGRKEEVRPGMIAGAVGSSKSALSQVLRSLEEKGFIERRRSEKDSRAVVLVPTKRAKEEIDALRGVLDQEMAELIAYIGLDDLRHLKKTVDKIVVFKEMREKDQDVHDGSTLNQCCTQSSQDASTDMPLPGFMPPPPFMRHSELFDCMGSKDKPCE